MSSNQKRLPFYIISPPNTRRAHRQVRPWLKANGLTIVLVFAMMVVAWMVAER
jgi:hypothetical protein